MKPDSLRTIEESCFYLKYSICNERNFLIFIVNIILAFIELINYSKLCSCLTVLALRSNIEAVNSLIGNIDVNNILAIFQPSTTLIKLHKLGYLRYSLLRLSYYLEFR